MHVRVQPTRNCQRRVSGAKHSMLLLLSLPIATTAYMRCCEVDECTSIRFVRACSAHGGGTRGVVRRTPVGHGHEKASAGARQRLALGATSSLNRNVFW